MDAHDAPVSTILGATVVTEDDLIAALMSEASDGNPHGARTVTELVALTGLCRQTVLARLRGLKADGLLGVTKVRTETVDGRAWPTTAYYWAGR